MRKSLIEAVEGRPLTITGFAIEALGHNLNHIELRRQDTLCDANVTPRYSAYSKKEVSSVMRTQMCVNWDKLEAWARPSTQYSEHDLITSLQFAQRSVFLRRPANNRYEARAIIESFVCLYNSRRKKTGIALESQTWRRYCYYKNRGSGRDWGWSKQRQVTYIYSCSNILLHTH